MFKRETMPRTEAAVKHKNAVYGLKANVGYEDHRRLIRRRAKDSNFKALLASGSVDPGSAKLNMRTVWWQASGYI